MKQIALKAGARVPVINSTLGGRVILEGHAVLVRRIGRAGDDRWLVRFENGDKVERWIDRASLADPAAYVAAQNKRLADAAAAARASQV